MKNFIKIDTSLAFVVIFLGYKQGQFFNSTSNFRKKLEEQS